MTTAPARPGPTTISGGPGPVLACYINPRERQVLVLAANGHTNKAIGAVLHISEDTVKTRMRSILRKLRSDDRTQATAVALRLGLIGFDDIALPGDLAHREQP